jgi:hypothetical protein
MFSGCLQNRLARRHRTVVSILWVWGAKTSSSNGIVDFLGAPAKTGLILFDGLLVLLRSLLSGCQSRRLLLLENLALRHQLLVLQRQTRQPKLRPADRLLWLTLRRLWPDWQKGLSRFHPQTVIAWHRLGFRLFWRWKSHARGGRPTVDRQLINLIGQMWASNPTWGSQRIQAELAKLGIEVSDSTVRQYRPQTRRGDQTWKPFLHNHVQDLVAVDFLVVPTATFRVL